jgi:glucose-1-phosphate adenylyltransferase
MAGVDPPFVLGGTWPILTCENDQALKQYSGDNVQNSIIGAGCLIKGRVENSVLSPGVHVDEQAVVKNSILMSNASVGLHSVVDSCIADENVNIGQFCYVGFGSDRNGMTEYTLLGKNAAVSSHTAVSRGCKILPDSNPTESLGKVFIENYHREGRYQKSNQNRITA